MRILSSGLLVPWENVLLWVLLPMPGTLLAMLLWYILRYIFDLRHPLSKRMRECRAEAQKEINELKAGLLDLSRDRDEARRDAERYLGMINEAEGVIRGWKE